MAKAILVTAQHKANNPKLFQNATVGEYITFRLPKNFIIEVEGELYDFLNFDANQELQDQVGVEDIVIPPHNKQIEKLGNKLVKKNGVVTYDVILLTEEEIAQREDANIPATLSKLAFKTRLLNKHSITDSMVDQVIAGIQDEVQQAKLKLMWYQADFFERSNPYLYQFAPALGLTETDIINLFKDEPNDE